MSIQSTITTRFKKKLPLPFDHSDSYTREEWTEYIEKQYEKLLTNVNSRKGNSKRWLESLDLIEPYFDRRKTAILNTIDYVTKRYSNMLNLHYVSIGKEWISINLSLSLQSYRESDAHFVLAAALWILDHLPDNSISDYELLNFQHSYEETTLKYTDLSYDTKIVNSLVAVLLFRNGKKRSARLIDERFDKYYNNQECNRSFYECILSKIPQGVIEEAKAFFDKLFWEWTDSFFEGLKPFLYRIETACQKYNSIVNEYNQAINAFEYQLQKLKQHPEKQEALSSKTTFENCLSLHDSIVDLQSRMEHLERMVMTAQEEENKYIISQAHPGFFAESNNIRFEIHDPFAVCFALLYLSESEFDTPWLYGPTICILQEVLRYLPWARSEYNNLSYDDIDERNTQVASCSCAFSLQRYHGKDDYPQNLYQIIYEHTGFLLPRVLSIKKTSLEWIDHSVLDPIEKRYISYIFGILEAIEKKEGNTILSLEDKSLKSEEKTVMLSDNLESAKHEIVVLNHEVKKQRTIIYEYEKRIQALLHQIESLKQQQKAERKELLQLRDHIVEFHNACEETETAEESDLSFPYTVENATVVFGGHETWRKALRAELIGCIRFIDKEAFALDIVRNAKAIWIQANAISHSLFYRVLDSAKQYNKSVFYCSTTGVRRCAIDIARQDLNIE